MGSLVFCLSMLFSCFGCLCFLYTARWIRFMTGLAMESLYHYGSSPVLHLSRGFLLVTLFYTSLTAPDRHEQEDRAD
ncbi:hypothetical protein M419DRAFT_119136 [Trichoderma reesei RUT C-30]|uniref:Uncharacterized protein n=1 Tax=Hypocrea jecorina (strain ATCC 56765 / BCRC 32924 / NRRL 11460 / Rut C-30) TaxID=1344414 RepID=A0A024SCN7_HYPJR|nr:hypothetical protein M419DRAFT_119136 [Trichoderma reesei RUT C-30]